MVDKYNFELDMVGDNSNSLILRNILPNSNVLEFGPAHGRMTKYLKENLNCKVTIVELDEEAGNSAKIFAEESFIGNHWGDIEKYQWLHHLDDAAKKFDYIIFADVLEHLYDPWKVLSSVKNLLKDNGSLFISIPNIGHNSVIIDLLNGKFEYREVGLLDNTHIRFFTRVSLQRMINEAGFEIEHCFDAHNIVENTELGNSYNDVPEHVAEYLRQRPDGDVYQYVWSLRKN
jgi:2-polyprenyl-3-methyl-5-hydroxy-6-metoxy-1,4-benzoquinol methylase